MKTSFGIIVGLAVLFGSCAASYKATYFAGTTARTLIDEAQEQYSSMLHERIRFCDPNQNPNIWVETQKDFYNCLGPEFSIETQEKIVQALGSYTLAANAMSAVMIGCRPDDGVKIVDPKTCVKNTFTAKETRVYRAKLIQAAKDVLELFPGAERRIKRLLGAQ